MLSVAFYCNVECCIFMVMLSVFTMNVAFLLWCWVSLCLVLHFYSDAKCCIFIVMMNVAFLLLCWVSLSWVSVCWELHFFIIVPSDSMPSVTFLSEYLNIYKIILNCSLIYGLSLLKKRVVVQNKSNLLLKIFLYSTWTLQLYIFLIKLIRMESTYNR